MEYVCCGMKEGRNKKKLPVRELNPGHPRDRREYSPLYYNDLGDHLDLSAIKFLPFSWNGVKFF